VEFFTIPGRCSLFNTVSIIPVNTTKGTGNKAVMFNNKYLHNKRKYKTTGHGPAAVHSFKRIHATPKYARQLNIQANNNQSIKC